MSKIIKNQNIFWTDNVSFSTLFADTDQNLDARTQFANQRKEVNWFLHQQVLAEYNIILKNIIKFCCMWPKSNVSSHKTKKAEKTKRFADTILLLLYYVSVLLLRVSNWFQCLTTEIRENGKLVRWKDRYIEIDIHKKKLKLVKI